jgi:3-oxoacyl-[acyl-carrier-protein] synthase II
MINDDKVVITGLGVLSPFGLGRESFLDGIKTGKSCAASISRFDTDKFLSKKACLVADENFSHLDSRLARLPRVFQYGVVAVEEALLDSGLQMDQEDKARIGIFFSTSCNTQQTERYHLDLIQKQPSAVSPLLFQNTTYMAGPGTISIKWGITGPAIAIPGGYASGIQAVTTAVMYLLQGYIDVAIVVGADELTRLQFEALSRLKLLSPQTSGDEEISRPFDAGRDGMVVGEGAGVLILETLPHASARGAKVYAEVAGVAVTHDAYRAADVCPQGTGLENAMRLALAEAGVEGVDYIAAAANATRALDAAEAVALNKVFGQSLDRVAVSSLKSLIGETLAAGGIFNVIACLYAMRENFVPPTLNHRRASGEGQSLSLSPHARQMRVDTAMANGHSFGGSCGSIVLRSFT